MRLDANVRSYAGNSPTQRRTRDIYYAVGLYYILYVHLANRDDA